ncbi:hypothetical protein D9M69_655590 [compost metagenome]
MHVLLANGIEDAREPIAVTVFQRDADHVRLLALFTELEPFLQILDGAQLRGARHEEFRAGLSFELVDQQIDGATFDCLVQRLTNSTGQWLV